jgi:hypothetical protein
MAVLTWPKPAQNATTLLDAVQFIKAANADPDLTQSDKTVLCTLALKHYNFKTQRLDPSVATIAKGTALKPRAAAKAIARLQAAGYIGIVSGRAEGRPNRYRIHWGVRTAVHTGVCTPVHTNLRSSNRRSASEKESYRVSSGGADRDTEGDLVRLARPPAPNGDGTTVGVKPAARTADGGAS